MKITTAVIMAAGLGTRFGQHTELFPKGFVKVGGQPMIIRSVEMLISCGIERIIIGTGYKKEKYEALKQDYPQVETCYSPEYANTNSMYTLYNTRNAIGDQDFLLLESDLIYEKKAILSLLECPKPDVMLISSPTKFQDQYFIEHDSDGYLTRCSTNEAELHADGEMVGIHKLSNTFYQAICTDYAKKVSAQPRLGYEYQLLHISQSAIPLYVHKVENLKWYEIDDEADLLYAEEHIVEFC